MIGFILLILYFVCFLWGRLIKVGKLINLIVYLFGVVFVNFVYLIFLFVFGLLIIINVWGKFFWVFVINIWVLIFVFLFVL